MLVRVTCPKCDCSYTVDDVLRGKKVRCRGCEATVAVPAADTMSSKPASAPVK